MTATSGCSLGVCRKLLREFVMREPATTLRVANSATELASLSIVVILPRVTSHSGSC